MISASSRLKDMFSEIMAKEAMQLKCISQRDKVKNIFVIGFGVLTVLFGNTEERILLG